MHDTSTPLPRGHGAPRLLFVCHGNILRSAVAAGCAERLRASGALPADTQIVSAGLQATPGGAADPRGVRVARDMGIDLSGHTARRLDRRMVGEADLILVMDLLNAAELLSSFPEAGARTRLLGAYRPGWSRWPEIPDPYSEDETEIRRVFTDVVAAIQGLAARVAEAARISQE